MKAQFLKYAISFFAGASISLGAVGAITKRVNNVKIAIEKRDPGIIIDIWEARDTVIVNHGSLLETLANENGKIELADIKEYAIEYQKLNQLENIE